MKTAGLFLLPLAASLWGCGPHPRPATVVYRIALGAATPLSPGSVAGYGITANSGGAYRLVWTGDAANSQVYRNFTGSVTTSGRITSLAPGCVDGSCPISAGGSVSAPSSTSSGDVVTWDTATATGVEGFDFVVDTEPVYFDLVIDGQRNPHLVTFPDATTGGQPSSVSEIPFGLTSR